MIATYYIAEIFLALLSIMVPKLNRPSLLMAGLILFLAAGFRTGGLDYQNYVNAIEYVHESASKSFMVQLVLVKDPLMLAMIHFCRIFSQGSRLVFLAMSALAVVPKMVVADSLGARSTLFMVVYATLLAPGLEFEAMRAAVALGFLLLLITWFNRGLLVRWVLALVSVGAHVAAVPFTMPRLLQRGKGKIMLAILPVLVAIPGYATSSLLRLIPRFQDYQNNLGTSHAFLPPIATYVAYLITNASLKSTASEGTAAGANICAAIAIGLGIGLAPVAVTVAFRFLEYGWAFMVLLAIARDESLPPVYPPRLSYHMLSLLWLGGTIVTANAMRSVLAIPI